MRILLFFFIYSVIAVMHYIHIIYYSALCCFPRIIFPQQSYERYDSKMRHHRHCDKCTNHYDFNSAQTRRYRRLKRPSILQNEEQPTVDETTNDRPDILGHSKEAAAEARGLLSEAVFHPTNTRESGDSRHRRRGRRSGRHQEFERSAQTHATTTETTDDRSESRREFLLLLADATLHLRAVQSLDLDRPSKHARIAGTFARNLAQL